MSVPLNKEEARTRVVALVEAFRHNADEYTRAGSSYNETQARTEFISPLLEALGWDVYNSLRQPLDLREVFTGNRGEGYGVARNASAHRH